MKRPAQTRALHVSRNSIERIDKQTFISEFGVSRETADRLEAYHEALLRWQRAINLVAPATVPQIWHRHFADSAQLAVLVPPAARSLVDLGSGAGFPGMVLAIMLMGDAEVGAGGIRQGLTRVILVESDTRKAAFLRDVGRITGTPVEILSTRIEKRETQASIGKVDIVTARALAPLDRLLGLAEPLFGADTVGLFLKGQDAQIEIDKAREQFSFDVSFVPSLTHVHAGIAVIRRLGEELGPKREG